MAAACNSSDPQRGSSTLGPGVEAFATDAGASFGSSDASLAAEASTTVGNPLCGVDDCTPDDDGESPPALGARPCAEPPDAGSTAADAESDAQTNAPACRVAPNDGKYGATCMKEADRQGVDGVYCLKGSDCAPGFDCILGETGPVCRRYCCSGSCESQYSQNTGPTFCDIQKLVDYSIHMVPVCMPRKTCKLLQPGECGAIETCAIVTEKGDTGCVPTGYAKAGEPCETEHCARDLTCLGSLGNRRCYELCRVDGADCEPTQKCATGTAFADTTFGVCKDD